MAAFSNSYTFRITDLFTRVSRKMKKANDKFTKSMAKTQKVANKTAGSLLNFKNLMGTAAVTAAAAFPLKEALDFQEAMIDLNRVSEFKSPEQFQKMKDDIMALAEETGIAAKKIAMVGFTAKKAGVPEEGLSSIMKKVVKSAIVFKETPEVIAESMVRTAKKIQQPLESMNVMMDAVAVLGHKSDATGKRIMRIIGRTAGAMGQIKMPVELIAGWSAFADMIEVTPRLAASGLRSMIREMFAYEDVAKEMLVAPNETIKKIISKLSEMDPIESAKFIKDKFSETAGKFLVKAVLRYKDLEETLGKVADKKKFLGQVDKEAAEILAGLMSRTKQTLQLYKNTAIIIGNSVFPEYAKFLDILESVGKKLKAFAIANPALSKTILLSMFAVSAIMALSVAIGVAAATIGLFAGLLAEGGLIMVGFGVIASGFASIMAGISLVFATLFSPIGLIIGAIALFGFMLYKAYKQSKPLRDAVHRLGNAFKPLFRFVGVLIKGLGHLVIYLLKFFSTAKFGTGDIDLMISALDGLSILVEFVGNIFTFLSDVIETFIELGPEKTFEILGQTMKAVGGIINGYLIDGLNATIDKFNEMSDWIRSTKIGSMIVSILGDIKNKFTDLMSNIDFDGLEKKIKSIWATIKDYFTDLMSNIDFDGLGEKIKAIGEIIKDYFIGALDVVIDKFNEISDWLGSTKIGSMLGGIKDKIVDFVIRPEDNKPIVKQESGVAANYSKVQQVAINGGIDINVTGSGRVTRSRVKTSGMGNLGFNMAGAG